MTDSQLTATKKFADRAAAAYEKYGKPEQAEYARQHSAQLQAKIDMRHTGVQIDDEGRAILAAMKAGRS